jgi:hypothetical protein
VSCEVPTAFATLSRACWIPQILRKLSSSALTLPAASRYGHALAGAESAPASDQRAKTRSKDRTTVNNVNSDRPEGNAKAAALRKLRKDAPELHAKVLAKEMTAHAAMVQAGSQTQRDQPTSVR